MVHTTINVFDLIVFGILGLSALLSFFRGFVREVMSLGTWAGAAIITLYLFPHVATMLKPHVNNVMVASGFAALFTFMASLIVLSVFSSLFLKFLKSGSEIGLLDNGMGLVFGILRGGLLIAVGFFIFTLTTPKKDYPDWMTGAVTLPYVEEASQWVSKVAPTYLDDVTKGDTSTKHPIKDKVDDAEDKLQDKLDDAESSQHWPNMSDLKDKMKSDAPNSDEPASGGY